MRIVSLVSVLWTAVLAASCGTPVVQPGDSIHITPSRAGLKQPASPSTIHLPLGTIGSLGSSGSTGPSSTVGVIPSTTWTQVGPSAAPQTGFGDAAAFDAKRGVLVYFGANAFGCGGSEGNDTWELSGATWIQRTQLGNNGPSTRINPGLVYDDARGVTLLFGGSSSFITGGLNDTWTWEGTAWTQLSPSTTPPARNEASLAYDSARHVAVLFGGYDDNGNQLTDTWEWNGANWTQLSPTTSPSIQGSFEGVPMFYDSARQVTTLIIPGVSMWTWDGTNWTQLQTPAANLPPAGGSITFDSTRQVAVLLGGDDGNDTWEWNGSAWTQAMPADLPPAGSIAYDSIHQVTVLPSGNDVWQWKGSDWNHVAGYGVTIPVQRSWHAMAFDSKRGVSVLFGGEDETLLGDTWEFNGTWTSRPTEELSPSARVLHAMAYDSRRGVTVLFGGCADVSGSCASPLNDTWEWDGTTWTELSPTTSPPGRQNHAMAYDSARGVTVLFGGTGSAGDSADTWEWNGTTWTQLNPTTSPSARNFHAMAYDAAHHVTVLFGGVVANNPVGDTWEWDGTSWTKEAPAAAPSARVEPALAYDSVHQGIILYGGEAIDFGPDNDTWEWNGANWMQLQPASSPGPLSQQAMVFDSARGVTTLFGGTDGFEELGGTWSLQEQ